MSRLAPLAFAFALPFAAQSAQAALLTNGSFEAGAIAADSFCISFTAPLCPSLPGWTGDLYVVNGAPQAITPLTPLPDGSQFAVLQAVNAFRQSVTIPSAGDYELSWWDAGRQPFIGASGNETYDVKFGGAIVGTFSTVSGSAWTKRTVVFSASAGTFDLEIVGKVPFSQGDQSALLDDFQLQPFVAPEPQTLVLGGSACAALSWRRRRQR